MPQNANLKTLEPSPERLSIINEALDDIFPFRNIQQESFSKLYLRDGVPVEKGVIITERYMEQNYNLFSKYSAFFAAYPDIFLDLITPSDSNISLFFYQRIFLRALMRYRDVYVVAPRGFGKSFITILALFLQCVFFPGTKRFITAPVKRQGAAIAKEKIEEIFRLYPLLRREVIGGDKKETPGKYGNDYVELNLRNGSRLDVVGAAESTRGGRRHGGLIDEVREHDETLVNEVVIPLMSVARYLPSGIRNPKEPNEQQVFVTSAGARSSFAYSRLLDTFQNSILHPEESFCFSCDYTIPLLHGLIGAGFVNNLKMSPSYSEESFAQEFLSIWSGGSDESWYGFEELQQYRTLQNPEPLKYAQKHIKNPTFLLAPNVEISDKKGDFFYLTSTDIGRLRDQTAVVVFKVFRQKNRYAATVVDITILGKTPTSRTFTHQAADLKDIILAYNSSHNVIDINGIGMGFADEMIKGQTSIRGEYLVPFGFSNDDDLKQVQPKDAPQILYGIKANLNLNSEIHSNTYTRLNNGSVRFLIDERKAKNLLLSTHEGQKMSPKERIERLLPHEMTTKLFMQMANLRLKRTSGTNITLEQINSRFPKDIYSAFSYGLWRIKELEEDHFSRLRRDVHDSRKLVFYTGGR